MIYIYILPHILFLKYVYIIYITFSNIYFMKFVI